MSSHHVIVVSGSKQGVGKTTFAVNFALQYALSNKTQVVFLDADMQCCGDASYYANLLSTHTIASLFQTVGKINLDTVEAQQNLFKGRIAFSDTGLSIVSLAENEQTVASLEPAQLLKVLAVFRSMYTFVIDIENCSEAFSTPLFDMADFVFEVMVPTIPALNATLRHFERLRELNFTMEKFGVIVNEHDMPEGLTARMINAKLQNFQKSILETIPVEKNVLRLTNARQMLVTEDPHSQFAKSIRSLVESLSRKLQGAPEDVTPSRGLWKDIVAHLGSTESSIHIPQGTVFSSGNSEESLTKEQQRQQMKAQVHKQMIDELNTKKIDLSAGDEDPQKAAELRKIVEQTANAILNRFGNTGFSRQETQDILKEIMDDALGLGPLEDLLRDKSVTEIMVNKKDQIYIEQHGILTLIDKKFNSDEQVVQVIRRIISPLGRRIDESVPLVDARLKDGSRVNAIIPPLAVQGPMITIRRFPEKALQPADLIAYGSITQNMLDFMRAGVICEKNIIVSGGTGSGKTTFLNMLSSFIPDGERIVTVEDVAELRLQQNHLGRLESRPPNIEGKGEITIRDLVRNTLRMRPDRIIVGECRGGESLDMLQAMNTGHDGSMTTIHANNPRDMISRLEAMVLMSGAELPIRVIRNYIASAINLIVQIARLQDGTRKVIAISEVVGIENEAIELQDIFMFRRTGVDAQGKVLGVHESTGIIPKCFDECKLRGVDLSIDIFKKNK